MSPGALGSPRSKAVIPDQSRSAIAAKVWRLGDEVRPAGRSQFLRADSRLWTQRIGGRLRG
jgi:hypothetical protein